jgi:hypothetical protein
MYELFSESEPEPEEVDLAEFLEVNSEGLTPDELRWIAAMQPGDTVNIGGGAAEMFTLRRVA